MKTIFHHEFTFEPVSIEYLESLIALAKKEGSTHVFVNYYQDEYPYMDFGKLTFQEIYSEDLKAKNDELFGEDKHLVKETYLHWLKETRAELGLHSEMENLSLNLKTSQGRITKALLTLLGITYRPKNKTDLLLVLRERLE